MPEAFVSLQVAGSQTKAMSKIDFLRHWNRIHVNQNTSLVLVLRFHKLSINYIKEASEKQSSPSGFSVYVTAAHNGASYLHNLSLKNHNLGP